MSNSILLKMTTKESDNIQCENCGKGIYIPKNPESEINHSFYCNYCGVRINLDADVVVE